MIITLCGSSRFEAWFHMWNQALGLAGRCAFGLSSYPYGENRFAIVDLLKSKTADAMEVAYQLPCNGVSQ